MAAAIVLVLLFAAARGDAAVSRCGRVARAPRAATVHQLRTSVLCLVNLVRERHGIPRLRSNPALRRSASVHSKNMVRSRIFSHYGPSGSTPMTRIARSGYLAGAAAYRVAEDIGAGRSRSYGSPLAIVRQWMHSPSHRRNILDRGLRDFGAGIARGDPLGGYGDAATYTLDFGTRRG